MYVDWILLAKDRVLLTCCCEVRKSWLMSWPFGHLSVQRG